MFQVPALIQGISTLRDRTLKITCYTSQELLPEEMTEIFKLEQKEGWMVFSENEINECDIPKEDAPKKEKQSQSQRLYNVMYVFWKQQGFSKVFSEWREIEMERLIEEYKSKLN